jgi:hypothetical protein
LVLKRARAKSKSTPFHASPRDDDLAVGLDRDGVGHVQPRPREAERDELLPVPAEARVELPGGRVAGDGQVRARPPGRHDLAVRLDGQAVRLVVERGGSAAEPGQDAAVAVERDVPPAVRRVPGQREVVVPHRAKRPSRRDDLAVGLDRDRVRQVPLGAEEVGRDHAAPVEGRVEVARGRGRTRSDDDQ